MEALNRLRNRLDKNRPPGITTVNEKKSINVQSAPRPSIKPSPSQNANASPSAAASKPKPWPMELKTPQFNINVLVYNLKPGSLDTIITRAPERGLGCWVFVSSGLFSIAGGELVLFLKHRKSENPAAYPLDFLRICDRVAGEAQRHGKRIRRWQTLEFDEPLFGRKEFHTAILGFQNAALIGIEDQDAQKITRPYFHVTLLTDDEAAVARKYGSIRAFVVRTDSPPFYPFPPFVDRDRISGSTVAALEGSASIRTPSNQLPTEGLNVVQEGQGIYLLVPPNQEESFKSSIPFRSTISQNPMRIESEIHEACDSVYYWGPNDRHPARRLCAGPLAERLTALNFLTICPNQPVAAIKPVEDGCLVFMSATQSKEFFAASICGFEFNMSAESMTFHLRWESPWPSPARSILTTEAMSAAAPVKKKEAKNGATHIELGGLIFLRKPSDDRNLIVEKFGELIDAIDGVIMNTIPKPKPASLPEGCGVCVQFKLPLAVTSPFKLATSSSIANSALPINEIMAGLECIPRINAFAIPDTTEVQVLYACWGFQTAQFGAPPPLYKMILHRR
ncbi:hypothetical protein N7532_001362 [Penicillium argentinense]|uniref:Uncharacterized protein n=1 Tax=Penicillium argentinense TaxID=1131581 RepID=A0A9W9G3X6_9EURO|nr:uncharacterized protein N7532_001362 [Penicillium argentinense]KAJ5110827.1 hypothetical protein N7532_001362 [Penicillium argentinense]